MVRSVGVLLVHGMGVQPEGDTLAYMGDPLLTWASSWLAGHGGRAEILPCSPKCRATTGQPRHVHAEWIVSNEGRADDTVQLLIAEAWWASVIDAPSASKVSGWITSLIWGVAWRGLLGIALIVCFVTIAVSQFAHEPLSAAFVVAVALSLGLCLFAVLLPSALLLVGKLPGSWGNASQACLNFLILWVGDVMVYEQNPRDTFAARQKIGADLRWLTARTDHALVVAHSLGSLLSIDVLSQVDNAQKKVKFFVSFGCAVKLLERHQSHYLARINQVDRALGWVNFFDPLDFIGGPVVNESKFPYNVKVDNGCTIIGAHGGYPNNAEQFQHALFRLIMFKPQEDGDAISTVSTKADAAVTAAFRSRWFRYITASGYLAISLPSAMAGAFLLFKNGWPAAVASMAQSQKFLSDPIKRILDDAATNPDEHQRTAGGLLISLATSSLLVLVVVWVGHLILLAYDARAAQVLAADNAPSPWRRTYRILLAAIWAALAVPIVGSLFTPWPDGIKVVFILAPFGPAAGFIIWMLIIRRSRSARFEINPDGRERRVDVAEALGAPYFKINYSPPKPAAVVGRRRTRKTARAMGKPTG